MHRQILDRTFVEANRRQERLDELLRTNRTQDQSISIIVQRLGDLQNAISDQQPEMQINKLKDNVKRMIYDLKLSTYLDVDGFLASLKGELKDIIRLIEISKEVSATAREKLQSIQQSTAKLMLSAEIPQAVVGELLTQLETAVLSKKYADVLAIETEISEKLRMYSKSENLMLQKAVDNIAKFPIIYRALAVYRRQVGKNSLVNQLKLINPLVSDPEFELRERRRANASVRLQEIISNLTQIPVKKLQYELTAKQTKPWLDYGPNYKFIVALPGSAANPAPKIEDLQPKDPRKLFLGRYTQVKNYYHPSYTFWKFYNTNFGGTDLQGFDKECNMTEKMQDYFLNPDKQQMRFGLLEENTNEEVWFSADDFRKECEYYKTKQTLLDYRVDRAPQHIRALLPMLVSRLDEAISQLKQNKDLLMDTKQQAQIVVEGLFTCVQREKATYRAVLDKFFVLKYLFESGQTQFFHTMFIRMNKNGKSMLWYFEIQELCPEAWLLEDAASFKRNIERMAAQQTVLFEDSLQPVGDSSVIKGGKVDIASVKMVIAELQEELKNKMFISDQQDVLKQQCKNKDSIKGDVIFYYTSEEDNQLYCAGFEELNQVIHPDDSSNTTGIPQDIQDIIKRLFTLENADYDANFSEIRIQVMASLDQYLKDLGKTYFPSDLIKEVYEANEEIRTYRGVVEVDIKYPELAKIVAPLRLQTPQLQQQALEILVNHVYMQYRKKLVDLIEQYSKTEAWQKQVQPALIQEAQARAQKYGAIAQSVADEQIAPLRQPRAEL
jgi:hypothetical protein